jgi:hypothetical protein
MSHRFFLSKMFSLYNRTGKTFHSIVKKEQLFDFFCRQNAALRLAPAANLRTNVRVFRCCLGRRRPDPNNLLPEP